MIGVHTGGFAPARDTEAACAAVARLGIEHPVVVDERLEIWDFYGNEGWPARYLWDAQGALYSMHYGEGAYEETEREIQALLGVEREPLAPCAPRTPRARSCPAQTADQPGAYSGPYEAGGVWAVLEGAGEVARRRARVRASTAPGCYPLPSTPHHTAGVLDLEVGPGVDLPRHVLHAGGRSSRVPALAQQADEPRRARRRRRRPPCRASRARRSGSAERKCGW